MQDLACVCTVMTGGCLETNMLTFLWIFHS